MTRAILAETITLIISSAPNHTDERLARFRDKLQCLRRDTLLNNLLIFLEQAESAACRGDTDAFAWAAARWGAVLDALGGRVAAGDGA